MKRTDKKQITIKADVLEKIFDEAVGSGRRPALGIELNGRNYVLQLEEDDIAQRSRMESKTCCGGPDG